MATDSILRPGELKDLLLKEIKAADLADIDVREVGTVLEVKDGIARIYGLTSAMAGEMLEFSVSVTGEKITGLALNLEEDNIGAAIFGGHPAARAACSKCQSAPPWSAVWSTRSAARWTGSARSIPPRRAKSKSSRRASSSASRRRSRCRPASRRSTR